MTSERHYTRRSIHDCRTRWSFSSGHVMVRCHMGNTLGNIGRNGMMDTLGSILLSLFVCTLFGFALFGYLGVTVQMWALGTLAVAFLGFLLGAGA